MKKVIIPAFCVLVCNYSKIQTEHTGTCHQNRTSIKCESGQARLVKKGLIYRTDSTIVQFAGNNVITYWLSADPYLADAK